ncbi:MAG TPA: hypothetical protein VE690_04720 [Rhodopila sp.]|nr:hypothetical protein [Rhodopila sp.]
MPKVTLDSYVRALQTSLDEARQRSATAQRARLDREMQMASDGSIERMAWNMIVPAPDGRPGHDLVLPLMTLRALPRYDVTEMTVEVEAIVRETPAAGAMPSQISLEISEADNKAIMSRLRRQIDRWRGARPATLTVHLRSNGNPGAEVRVNGHLLKQLDVRPEE